MPSLDLLPLSDAQMAMVGQAVEAIQLTDRDRFMNALARLLSAREIGDGSVSRAIRELLGSGTFRFNQTVAVGKTSARETRWSKSVRASG
jgi:hypothetical protein